MKISNRICNILLCVTAWSGLIYTAPEKLKVSNISGEQVRASFTIIPPNKQVAPYETSYPFTDNTTTEYEPRQGAGTVILSMQISNLKLDLKNYSEPITVIYDGNLLLEKSVYQLHLTSRAEKAKEYSKEIYRTTAAGFAVAHHWFSNQWNQWKQWLIAQQKSFKKWQKNELEQDHTIYVDNYSDYELSIQQAYTLTDQDKKYTAKKNSEIPGNAVLMFGGMQNTTKITIQIMGINSVHQNPIELFIDDYHHIANKHPGMDMHIEIYNTSAFWTPWQKYKGALITYKITWKKYDE